MKYKLSYSADAIRDLDRIWYEVHEACKDFDTTMQYLDELQDKIEARQDFPKSGAPLYYDNMFTGYYFVVFKSYLAFYRLDGDRMLVDRVLYAKSDYLRTLKLV